MNDRFPDDDTRSYERLPVDDPTGYGGRRRRPPRRQASGWMIAFLVLVLLIAAAALVYLLALRDSGDKPKGQLTLSATAIDFGDQQLGQRSAVQTVTITNGTGDPVALRSLEVTGNDPDDFSVTDETTCSTEAPLADGESCVVGLRFRPKKREERSATLLVRLGNGSAPLTLGMHGTGTGDASASVDVKKLEFGSVLLGKTRTLKVTLRNDGNAPLVITSIEIDGDDGYRIAKGTTCKAERKVKAGESCELAVAFSPQRTERATARLVVAHDADGSPITVAMRGSGKGQAELTADPTSLDFGEVEVQTTSGPRTITLTNAGTAPLTLPVFAAAGDFTTDPSSTCQEGAQLAPGDSCTVAVVFAPTSEGQRATTLVFADGGPTIELVGVGIPPAGATTTEP